MFPEAPRQGDEAVWGRERENHKNSWREKVGSEEAVARVGWTWEGVREWTHAAHGQVHFQPDSRRKLLEMNDS